MNRLQNKVCVITGGASGIGEGVAKKFAREGAAVIIADIDSGGAARVEAEIRDFGGRCDSRIADMGREADIADLFRYTEERYGRLDVLMTCAFRSIAKHAVDLTLEEWNACMSVTLTGPFLCSKYAIPLMQKNGGGSIIHTASVGAVQAFRNSAAYVTAKAGIVQLCKSIAVDFGRTGIRCNALSPGIIATPDTAADDTEELRTYRLSKCLTGRYGKPEDIANAALFLAGGESAYMTGSVMTVDAGWTAS